MDIEFVETKKLIIHGLYKTDYERFISDPMVISGQFPIFWCDGILFIQTSVPLDGNEKIIDDYVNGIIHWQEVNYCVFPKYEKDIPPNSAWAIKVINSSDYEPHRIFIKWLKSKM